MDCNYCDMMNCEKKSEKDIWTMAAKNERQSLGQSDGYEPNKHFIIRCGRKFAGDIERYIRQFELPLGFLSYLSHSLERNRQFVWMMANIKIRNRYYHQIQRNICICLFNRQQAYWCKAFTILLCGKCVAQNNLWCESAQRMYDKYKS